MTFSHFTQQANAADRKMCVCKLTINDTGASTHLIIERPLEDNNEGKKHNIDKIGTDMLLLLHTYKVQRELK